MSLKYALNNQLHTFLFRKQFLICIKKVNHSPSFTTDSKLDREIKDALIYDTIMLMNIGAMDKKSALMKRESVSESVCF